MAGQVRKDELQEKAVVNDGRKGVVLPLLLGDECLDAITK